MKIVGNIIGWQKNDGKAATSKVKLNKVENSKSCQDVKAAFKVRGAIHL